MPGLLKHAPAQIVAEALRLVAIQGSPAWLVTDNKMVGVPDEAIGVFDTIGRQHGFVMFGECQEHHGVQVKIRGNDRSTTVAKARRVAVGLDVDLLDETVHLGDQTYLVQCVNRMGDVLPIPHARTTTGIGVPSAKQLTDDRPLFIINAQAMITAVSLAGTGTL